MHIDFCLNKKIKYDRRALELQKVSGSSKEENKIINAINWKLFLWKSASVVRLRLSDKCEQSRRVRSHLRERDHGLQAQTELQIRDKNGVF